MGSTITVSSKALLNQWRQTMMTTREAEGIVIYSQRHLKWGPRTTFPECYWCMLLRYIGPLHDFQKNLVGLCWMDKVHVLYLLWHSSWPIRLRSSICETIVVNNHNLVQPYQWHMQMLPSTEYTPDIITEYINFHHLKIHSLRTRW